MKNIVLSFLILGTTIFILRNCPSNIDKIPPSISNALVHYATRNVTPQQTLPEISLAARVLQRKSPCNFLVFGLGNDSLLWASLNHGGKTVFLEEFPDWIRQMNSEFPSLDSHLVEYNTKVRDAPELLASAKADASCYSVVDPRESQCTLALKSMPSEVYEVEWDVVMVDTPTGYHDEAPGRMQAVYTAGLLGRRREGGDVDVFVHDVDRYVEDAFTREFLCEGYMVEEEGKLRHFRVPSHRTSVESVDVPFCPVNVSTNSEFATEEL